MWPPSSVPSPLMSTRTSVWTPRHTHKLWPKPKAAHPGAPVARPWVPPPPPTPIKKKEKEKKKDVAAEELQSAGDQLRREADALEQTAPPPGLRIQLGMIMLSKEDYVKKLLRDWDHKGKGEFMKAEFRLNLRNTGLNATSAEADELFDSWDDECAP